MKTDNILEKIKPLEAHIYFEDSFLGVVNEYEFNALRIKIKYGALEGYSVSTADGKQRVTIDKFGRLETWPAGLFNLISEQLRTLILPIDFKQKKNESI